MRHEICPGFSPLGEGKTLLLPLRVVLPRALTSDQEDRREDQFLRLQALGLTAERKKIVVNENPCYSMIYRMCWIPKKGPVTPYTKISYNYMARARLLVSLRPRLPDVVRTSF